MVGPGAKHDAVAPHKAVLGVGPAVSSISIRRPSLFVAATGGCGRTRTSSKSKVWCEKAPTGAICYVFFGLPADVEPARFLYDRIDTAFDT
jgi:hypothetical protein